jgi:alkanesulfonate monooxygenase
MPITPHWFLPTNGDSRSDLSLGNAVGAQGSRVDGDGQERAPDIGYIGQIARSAEQLGFVGALTPTSSWCEDAWVMTAALTQVTERFKFLVAFRPGLISPTLAAHMAATYQRVSGGRLLLNVVTGGDDVEQRRFGDRLDKAARYARCGEFRGEPPDAVAAKLDAVRERADSHGRELRFGVRLHVITRDSAEEAWAEAQRLLDGLDPAAIERAQAIQRASGSEGQRRMVELHGGRTDALEVYPNLWAGVGLVRGGAGTALVGSHEEVADRIAEYHDLGIEEFILSGYPHLEESYRVGEGVLPILRRRGLLASHQPEPETVEV